MIQYRHSDDEWEEFKNPPSWTDMKKLADAWGFSVRVVENNGVISMEYHPYTGPVYLGDWNTDV